MRGRLLALAAACATIAAGCEAAGDRTAQPAGLRSFCSVVADVNELYATTIALDVDSSMGESEIDARVRNFEDHLDASIERGERLFTELQATAPAELSPDIRIVADDAIARAKAFRDSGADPMALLNGLWPPSRNIEVRGALDRVDGYTRSACGTSFGPPPEPASPAAPPEPTAPPEPAAAPERRAPPAPPEPPAPPDPPQPASP